MKSSYEKSQALFFAQRNEINNKLADFRVISLAVADKTN